MKELFLISGKKKLGTEKREKAEKRGGREVNKDRSILVKRGEKNHSKSNFKRKKESEVKE